ncbi:uncharacterized protein LOC127663087 isoform X3 [Xyrauchen texanus]|nr:uncharacterized protein LOC127663087 isoform X3 [Xyrauchen texanus]
MMNRNKAMYAVALYIPNDDCNGDIDLQRILTGNDNNKKDKLGSEGGMYIGDRLMIARPSENTEHAEHRLLDQLKEKGWDTNSCVVFFVKDSPCTEKCLNEQKNNDNILELLETFKKWATGKKAFLFQDIFYQDLGYSNNKNPEYIPPPPKTRSQLLSAFRRIEKHVPLYRCNAYTQNGCIRCVNDEISLNDNECLYEIAKETESSRAGSKRRHGQSSTNNPNERSRKILKKGV